MECAASSESVTKSGSCIMSFSCLRDDVIIARIGWQCRERKHLFHKYQMITSILVLVFLPDFHLPTPPSLILVYWILFFETYSQANLLYPCMADS